MKENINYYAVSCYQHAFTGCDVGFQDPAGMKYHSNGLVYSLMALEYLRSSSHLISHMGGCDVLMWWFRLVI